MGTTTSTATRRSGGSCGGSGPRSSMWTRSRSTWRPPRRSTGPGAAARLRGEGRLLLIGGGDREAALRAQADRLGIAARVTFVPLAPAGEVPGWLRRLDALAAPSLTTPAWKEQFGRGLIEAMAVAVPVVGSDSGEIPRVIGDAGLVVPENSPAALAAALQGLLDDEGRRLALAAAGRE